MIIDSFDGQRIDEKVIAVWRRHPFILSKAGFITVAVALIGSLPLAMDWGKWSVGFLIFMLACGGLYGLTNYWLWLNTIFILTNQRVFAIYQKSLLSRTNNEVPLQNIQNVSHTKRGVFGMIMDFGDVEVETSGAKTALSIKDVPNPYFVQQKILSK
jgi:uncharacterized membrane protein YdbT with pleckstrin-like domain